MHQQTRVLISTDIYIARYLPCRILNMIHDAMLQGRLFAEAPAQK